MKLLKEVVVWRPVVEGREWKIPITIVRHPDSAERGVTQLHFYPGLGEEVLLTGYGVKRLARCGLPAIGVVLPFHIMPASFANIQRTLVEVPQFIAKTYNLRAGNPADMPVDLLGKSQGGGTVLLAAMAMPEKYRIIASMIPAGLNKRALGKEPSKRLRELKWRLGVLNNLTFEQSLIDPKNVLAWYEVLGRILRDSLQGRLNLKLNYTLDMDLTDLPGNFKSLATLAKTHDLAIFAGKRDPVVRLHEVRDTLRQAGLEHLLHEIPSIHANSASSVGQMQIAVAASWINTMRDNK